MISQTKSRWLAVLVISLAVLFVYSSVRQFDYLTIDDTMHTERNPQISPLTAENLLSFWRAPYENAFMPATYSMWMLLAELGRKDSPASANKFSPGIFHLGNLFFHWMSATLLFFLLCYLGFSNVAAFFGALLFAIHPLQVEAVAWMTGLRDVMAGAFALLTMLLFFRGVEGRIFYVLSLITFFLAVLAKSSALVTPILIAVIALGHLKLPAKRVFLLALPYAFTVLPLLPIFRGLNDAVVERAVMKVGLWDRLLVAADSLRFYLVKLIVPYPLIMDYGRTPDIALATSHIGIVLFLAALSIGTILMFRRFPSPAIGIVLFVVGVTPVLGIQPFIFQHISTVADRYLYLSVIGASWVVAWWLSTYDHPAARRAVGIVLLICAVMSARQTETWRDNFSIFSHVLKHNEKSWLASNNLGAVLEARGEWRRAADLYRRAGELKNIPSSWNNCGAALLKADDPRGAAEAFTRALVESGFADWAYNNLAAAYARGGRFQEAIEQLEKGRERNPISGVIAENLDRLSSRRQLHVQRERNEG